MLETASRKPSEHLHNGFRRAPGPDGGQEGFEGNRPAQIDLGTSHASLAIGALILATWSQLLAGLTELLLMVQSLEA